MNDPILSQAEIDALLNPADTGKAGLDEQLHSLFEPFGQVVQARIEAILQLPIDIEGPYVESVRSVLTSIYHEPLFIIPVEVIGQDVFVLLSESDASQLGNLLGTDGEK